MTSSDISKWRPQKVDELIRSDHSWLDENDECYFWGEYTAYEGYGYSSTNGLITNFKKPMDRRGRAEWRYKEQAIEQVARLLRPIATSCVGTSLALIPVPPSKARTDPLYDDRLVQALTIAARGLDVELRDCVVQDVSTAAVHADDVRPRPEELVQRYHLDESVDQRPLAGAVIFDDVLTTGCHFKAVKQLILSRFPGINVYGFFVARRAITRPDVLDL